MGEIIHHNFGASKDNSEIKESKDDGIEFITKLAGLLGGNTQLGPKIEKLILTMKKLEEMRTFLKSLHIISTTETKSMRDDLVRDMSFDDKCNAVINSNEIDWKTRPSYYIAISKMFTPEELTALIDSDLTPTF
jgi:hypothetical protein